MMSYNEPCRRSMVIGAGGIGGYYGARLQTAEVDVTYVARGPHLKAMQRDGLRVTHPTFTFHAPVVAVDLETACQRWASHDFDLVILTTKADATPEIMSTLAPWLSDSETAVLSLQNGVDNEPLIAAQIGDTRTIGGLAVRIGGHVVAPGHVEATGVAQVVLGRWPNVEIGAPSVIDVDRLGQQFTQAGIPTTVSPDIRKELWRKLLINNGVNPLSALTGLDTQALTHHPTLASTVYQMMLEAVEAAHVEGVSLTRKDADEMFELISTFDAIKTSMLVDREKGRPLELKGITGAVLSRLESTNQKALATALVTTLLEMNVGPRDS